MTPPSLEPSPAVPVRGGPSQLPAAPRFVWVAVVGLVLWRCLGGPPILTDESWFLQVVTRTLAGDVLYRDVFFGSTPLAVWLAAPFALAGGGKLLALRVLLALLELAMLGLLARLARQLEIPSPRLLLLAVPLFTLQHFSYYSPLAMLFLLACFTASLSYRETGSRRWLLLASVAAALSFAAKYHLGFAALGAWMVTILTASSQPLRARWRRAGAAAMLCAAAAGLLLAPVFLSGAGPAFADYVFFNKTRYVRLGLEQFAPVAGLQEDLAVAATLRGGLDFLFSSHLLFLLVPLALGVMALGTARAGARERELAWVVWSFTAAGLMMLVPQAQLPHLFNTAPSLLLALAWGWRALRPGRLAWVPRLALIWVLGGWLWVGARPLPHLVSGKWVRLATHPYTGMFMNGEHAAEFQTALSRLRSVLRQGKRPLLITNDAGSLYLASGLRNPSPYDLPAGTALGRHGEDRLIALAAAGSFPAVCVNEDWPRGNAPHRLLEYLRRHRRPGLDLGSCVLYEASSR